MELERITEQKRRATAAQRMQMVEQFRRSGLTRAAFSRENGISEATLGWWLAKVKRDCILPAPVAFTEIRVDPPVAAHANARAMELISSDGLLIRCRDPLPTRDVARLLRGKRC
jgi:transposase-like protein